MSLPDQWKNYLSVYLKIKEKTAQISSQKMQQPGVERQDFKAVVGQSSCLAALQPLPKTGAPTWSPPSSPPQTEQGELPQGLDPELPGCQGRWRRSGGFLYLVLQLHDLVVLPVQLHVLVLHDFEELLDVTVLLLHKSLAQGGKDGGGLRSSTRPSAVVLPL